MSVRGARWPRTLTGRLIATSVTLVAIVSLLVGIAATVVMRSYLDSRLDEQLARAMDRASGEIGGEFPGRPPTQPPDDALSRCVDRPPLALGQGENSITAVVTDTCSAGTLITEDGQQRDLASSVLTRLAEVETDGSPHSVDLPALGSFRVAATTTPTGEVVVQGLPTSDIDATISSLIRWEILLAIAGTGLAAGVATLLVRRQLRPLRHVAATAHDVAAMPLSSGAVGTTARVPDDLVVPGTEVGRVGEALNTLLGHVEHALDARHESEQQVRRFLADASHELRTPLATIQGYTELTRRTAPADPVILTQTLEKISAESGRMSALVEDMLSLARLDAGRPIQREPVDLSRLVIDAVDDARVVDPGRRWRLDVPAESVVLEGDALRLHQLVSNLLANATRHTPEGTTVTARVLTGPTRIEVADDGPGVDPALRETIFDRFTRGDSARTRASGGAGLGMSLVRAIAIAHGGDASVRSVPGDTAFTVTLP